MIKIDAHQHYWSYDPVNYNWINDDMKILKRDFLPDDLSPILKENNFDGSVAVQARPSAEENTFLLNLADHHEIIKGVVGWVDLQAENVEKQLEELAKHPKLCGIRHLVQDEPDDQFLLRKDFKRGISYLKKYDLTYDILIFPRHLPAAIEFVQDFPEQKFVLDHIAKPYIKDHKIDNWAKGLMALAKHPKVFCKLSGMVTEAVWNQWTESDFKPYLDVVFEAFGSDRLMIGSDWPVCTLSGEYDEVIKIVDNYIESNVSGREREKILGQNAVQFYGLNI
ncbi:MAG TPA: amidohydrolase family protein [Balneolales bacterium]|nr:amidohydrolase family protein [Balneolales bacterium]